MTSIDEIVDRFLREIEVDYIALPQISSAARWELGAHTTDEARSLSLEIAAKLYENGARPGDYWEKHFEYRFDDGCQAMLDRIERAWIEAGADPSLAEPICWFAPRPK